MPAGRMVRLGTISSLLGGAVLSVLATGCQTSSPAQPMATTLPPPNFAAPVIVTPSRPSTTVVQAPQLPATVNGIPREWIPKTKPNKWLWIVIHHTATPSGALARINTSHQSKGWDSAGYHFVIGNGTESKDGQIEVGPRWPVQKWGAHTKSPDNRFNDHGIGIVMVGNFDQTNPSKKQIESMARLVAYLMKTYNIPPDRVLGHRNTGRATDCPGLHTNVAQIRQMATRILADAGDPIPKGGNIAMGPGGELLRDATP